MLGDVIGASAAYAIGYFGLHEVLARKGPLHIDEAKIERANGWFDRFGSPLSPCRAASRCSVRPRPTRPAS